jgi:hypothetical protein
MFCQRVDLYIFTFDLSVAFLLAIHISVTLYG